MVCIYIRLQNWSEQYESIDSNIISLSFWHLSSLSIINSKGVICITHMIRNLMNSLIIDEVSTQKLPSKCPLIIKIDTLLTGDDTTIILSTLSKPQMYRIHFLVYIPQVYHSIYTNS